MSSPTTEIIVLGKQTRARIEGPLFGEFLELAGRCINHGLYDPESPQTRPDGIRAHMLSALRELRPTHLRYPGGGAVAHFNWQEFVGAPASLNAFEYAY
jgi:alpha-N-arabinofuranosidase